MESKSTGGPFSTLEKGEHMNVVELKAELFGLKSLAKDLKSTHIKRLFDNSTAVACINKFGTRRSIECDSLAQETWASATKANIWLFAPTYQRYKILSLIWNLAFIMQGHYEKRGMEITICYLQDFITFQLIHKCIN